MWQLSEVVVYSWRLIMKRKEPTNNDISILEQTLAVMRTPPGTRHCLNALKSHPEPQLSAHKPDK